MRILEGLILGNTRLFWTANYMNNIPITIFCFGATAPSGQWPPHSRGSETTYNNPPQSEGLLRTSDRLVAETSTWQHTTPTTDIHVTGGIRTHNPSKPAASDLRLRPRDHWDWHAHTHTHTHTHIYIYMYVCMYIQSVPGGRDKTSGECSLC